MKSAGASGEVFENLVEGAKNSFSPKARPGRLDLDEKCGIKKYWIVEAETKITLVCALDSANTN